MEHRKEKPKFSMKRRQSSDLFNDEPMPQNTNPYANSTPIQVKNRSEDEESPYFPCSTQEMRDDVDVLWDYNSPQSKPKTSVVKKSKKKLNLQHSPKVPLRRHASNNNDQIKQDFCKLREELRALRSEIAKPDHEESLILSPREEEAFKVTQYLLAEEGGFDHLEEQPTFEASDFEDPFDDEMDDKLILFTQQMEKEIHKTDSDKDIPTKNQLNFKAVNNCDNSPANQQFDGKTTNFQSSVMKKTAKTKKDPVASLQDSEVFNDSFENVFSQMDEDDFDQLTQVVDMKQYKNEKPVCNIDKKSKVFPRYHSEENVEFLRVQQTASGKVEWHRTQSFESYSNTQLSKEKMQEIERKRLEAKAKLEAKKKQQDPVIPTTLPEVSDSPLKCSPEEIEKKRLQALAKLEAKRQQEIIEKKKQEALKRREENRKKNAAHVKSSLSARL